MTEVIEEKTLSGGEVLKIIKIPEDQTEGRPENDHRLIMLLSTEAPSGRKFAPEVCRLLSRIEIANLFHSFNKREDFFGREREMITHTLNIPKAKLVV